METWRIMEDKAVAIDSRCCRSIIQAFSKGGYLKEALHWLTLAGEHDKVDAVLPLYNIILSKCLTSQSYVYADRCMELMEGQLVGKSETTYWELLKFAVSQKNLPAVHAIWKDCTKYYSPSILTLKEFIWSFTRLSALESAYAVLQHMVTQAGTGWYQPSRLDIPIPLNIELSLKIHGSKGTECSLHNLLETTMETENGLEESCTDSQSFPGVGKDLLLGSDNNYLEQTEFAELNLQNIRHQHRAFAVHKLRASSPVKKTLEWSFNNVIHACARAKNYKLAEHLFMQMHDLGLEQSGCTYDGFVKAVVYAKGVAYGMKVIESMEKRNIRPYNETIAVLSTAHSKNLDLDKAEDLLEKISDDFPKAIHPFNAILAACDIMDQADRAVHLLAKMKKLKIKPNIRTYELMFSLFSTVNVPYEKGNMLSHVDVSKRIKAIEMDMIKSGVQHSYTSMKNLIRALGAEGMINEMLQSLRRAESMPWDISSHSQSDLYNIALHALVKADESSKAIELFKNMRLFGFPANVATYNVMIECCNIMGCFKSASAFLSVMLRDGFVPRTLTYTGLAKVLLVSDDFDGAVCLVDQANSDGVQLDIQFFNTILKQAYQKGRIDMIELIVECIHRKGIQPDPSTCWYTFSAYVECDFYSTAMEALQVLSLRMMSEEDSILQDNKAAYEDLIYNEEPDAESKIIKLFQDFQEFIATGLLSLRWCAMNGLLVSWYPNESLWARRLSSSYSAKIKPSQNFSE